MDEAAVWLDGRYYLQGEDQLDCNWLMMRSDEEVSNFPGNLLKVGFWDSKDVGSCKSIAYPPRRPLTGENG